MKKTIRIISIIVGVLLILLFCGQWWLGIKIEHTIEDKIAQETQGKIRVDIGKVNVRLIGRAVLLRDIKITTDSLKPVKQGLPFDNIEADIRKVAIKGIHFSQKDSIHRFKIRGLEIDVSKGRALSRKSPGKKQSFGGDSGLSKLKAMVEADRIDVRLGQIQYNLFQGRDTASYQLEEFHCNMKNWRLNTVTSASSVPVSCEDMQISLIAFRNFFAEKSQLLAVDSLMVKGKEGFIEVGSVNLIPQYDKKVFALKVPGHTDWTKVQTGKIKCYDFDMQRLITEHVLSIDSVDLRHAEISSYKNRKIEQPKKVKKLFYESVQQFPVPLSIRTIRMNDIRVEYQEMAKNGLSPGTVTFNELEGTFDRLTNIVTPEQPYFTLKARGKLMGQALLQAVFRLPVDSLNPHFEVKGDLGKMNMEALNPIIEPLAKIRITSGEIESMNFDITGNSMKSRVDMVFLYQDLKIRMMKEKDGHLETSSFLTTLANGLIAKGNNPDHRELRKADATAERDIYRSQFNYLWRTLLAGLKVSIGLG